MTLFRVAFKLIKEELVLFFVVTVMTLYVSGMGIFYFEKPAQPEVFESMFDGLWWAVVTLTTVGYGDSYPVTVGGKIFTFVILFIGLAIVAVPTGLFATALSKARELSEKNSGD
jgi:voltage-gated potassium channel